MNSHAHVILELPAPKEVSMIWYLNLSVSFSSQDFSRFTRSRDRQSATNTPSYRCCPGSLLSSTASCDTLPVHRSGPALNAVALKVQIPMLKATVWWTLQIPRVCVREREREREPEREKKKISILSHAGYESSLLFFKFQSIGDSIPNEFRGTFRQRESKHTEALIGRTP
jgi:hypothetical protein